MGRLDKIKDQNPELNITLIDLISGIDPTVTYKYMDFIIKQIKKEYRDSDSTGLRWNIVTKLIGEENIGLLYQFETHSKSNRISNSDIGKYNDFSELSHVIEKVEMEIKMKELEKCVKKVFDDNTTWLVIIPLTYESSRVYGSNTKWCTTTQEIWDDYRTKYKLIYIINRKDNKKWAISMESPTKIRGWLSNDKESNPMNFPFPPYLFDALREEVKTFETIDEIRKNQIWK